MTPTVFTPLSLKNGLTLKNRIVKPAMNEAMGTRHLQPKSEIATLYRRWAEGGAGLLITGNVMVDSQALAEPGNVVFDGKSDMAVLRQWAAASQVNGTKTVVQINHPGKQAPKTVAKQPVAPSAVPISGDLAKLFNPPRELTKSAIKELVGKFATAAKVAQEAGFSGVQIHAAHGYLINQFLSPHDNRRSDEYGGSLENRMRFLVEIYQAMRSATGADFPIGVKINSSDFREGGFTEGESLQVVEELDRLGIDFVEVSGGSYERPTMSGESSKGKETIFFADYSQQLKARIAAPVILTGGVRSVAAMADLLDKGRADLVGLARPLAMVPDLPNQIANGTYETVETKRLTTGIAKLDKALGAALGLAYYQMLMQTIAKGRAPKLTTNAWPVLAHAIYHQGLTALFPQRAK